MFPQSSKIDIHDFKCIHSISNSEINIPVFTLWMHLYTYYDSCAGIMTNYQSLPL